MINRVFKIEDLTSDNFFYISESYLVSIGFNSRSLQNNFSRYKTKKSSLFEFFKDIEKNEKWVRYSSIPLRLKNKYSLPKNDEILLLEYEKFNYMNANLKNLTHINFVLFKAWNTPYIWRQWMLLYSAYYFDNSTREKFAKTHAIFIEVIKLKKEYSMKEILCIYIKLEDVVFRTENYNYFCRKINLAIRNGIEDVLVHDFKKIGRAPYKLNSFIQSRIEFYYSNPKQFSIKKITQLVNEEIILKEYKTVSYSLVQNYLKNPRVRNKCDILRYGIKKYIDTQMPYMSRKSPKHPYEIIMIDSTVLNIPSLVNDSIKRLVLCVVMDVFSSKIIGFSLGHNENNELILDALKKTFLNDYIIPTEILVDNHKLYHSKEFSTFKERIYQYGVNIRSSRRGNAKDKGQIEKVVQNFSN